MVLAILLGGIFGLLVAGGVLVVGMVRQARLDQHDMNAAFADARGEAHDPVVGPAPWSSFDMEALGEDEDGVVVDRSDPYATLTGVAAVSWSHSKEAIGEDDIPLLDDQPTHRTAEPDETFVAEPHETFVAEPEEIFVAEPHETFVAEPDETFVAEPEEIFVAEPHETFVGEPDETFVAKPAAMLPEPVDNRATPASIDEERPVVWRAPAQSQFVILVVALRALADGVAATITPEGATQLDGLEDALAHARGAYQRGNGNRSGRRSSIDVDGHDRPASDLSAASPLSRDDSPKHTSAPRRGTPSTPRRHSGPKPISWRPGVR
jgi:hypothetical protein